MPDASLSNMIPFNLLTIWGYKDESLTPQAAGMRTSNIRRLLQWDPQWCFLHVDPPHILKLAQELLQSVRDSVVSALQLNTEWVWKADVSRIVALHANGVCMRMCAAWKFYETRRL